MFFEKYMLEFAEKHKNGMIVRVRLSPNSSSCAVNGIMDAADGNKLLKISVNSVPEKGKANKELIEFMAKKIKVPKSSIEIISGDTERVKRLLISGKIKELEEKFMYWLGDMVDAK